MPEGEERREERRTARRLDRIVGRLLRGQRLDARADDAGDHETIRAAARLSGASEPYPRMDPGFRRELAARLARQPASGTGPSRRWALAAAAGLVGGAALGVVGERLAVPAAPANPKRTAEPPSELVPEGPGAGWVDTGLRVQDLEDGAATASSAGAMSIFLVRQGASVVALSGICTHQACQLVWRASDRALACPWSSGQAFGLDGRSLWAAGLRTLPRARVRVVDGRIEVFGTA